MNRIEEQVLSAKRPVALTGAGISAPSGIPTFQGTWRGRPIRDFLSRDFFEAHPRQFFELYCEMVSWCRKEPNPAHLQLAKDVYKRQLMYPTVSVLPSTSSPEDG